MAKFQHTQRVVVRQNVIHAPAAWLGLRSVIGVMYQAQGAPGGPWEPGYRVQFDDFDDWVLVRESWLEDETVYDLQRKNLDDTDEPMTYLGPD